MGGTGRGFPATLGMTEWWLGMTWRWLEVTKGVNTLAYQKGLPQ